MAASWLESSLLLQGVDDRELQRLAKVHSGPYGLSKATLHWLSGSNLLTRWLGLDANVPEALALSVRATRYGCRRAEPLGAVSRADWMALHRRFPATEAARRTPYWFDETRSSHGSGNRNQGARLPIAVAP
jgi:hypothetical protein